MTAQPKCYCGHTALAHELDEIRPQCAGDGCICQRYRPAEVAKPRSMTAHTPLPEQRPVKVAPAAEFKETAENLNADPPNASKPESELQRPICEPTKLGSSAVEIDRSKLTGPVDDLLAEAKTRTPQIRQLAEHIEASLANLRNQIAADDQVAVLRKRKIELEAELSEVNAELAKNSAEPAPVKAASERHPDNAYPCPDCEKRAASSQGLAAHRRIAHGYRKAEAS